MTDRIGPALTAEEWKERGWPVVDGYVDWEMQALDVSSHSGTERNRFIPAVIALANAALPDSDPKKITRAKLKAMRAAAIIFRVGDVETMQDDDATATLHQFADALSSYLPPEEETQ